MKAVITPSVVGIGKTELGLLGSVPKSQRPHVVEFDGAAYLVGDHVGNYASEVQRLDMLRLQNGPEAKALTYATLGKLLGPDSQAVSPVVGFPVEILLDREKAKETLKGLRSWLVGEHAFTLDGTPHRVTVEQIGRISQPAGTHAAWLNGHAGAQPVGNELRATVAVCDIGFNTVDLHVLKPGEKVAPRFTGGESIGMHIACEVLAKAIHDHYGVRLSLPAADALLRKAHPEIETRTGFVDVTAEARQAKAHAASQIVRFITGLWNDDMQASVILFTGGGSKALSSELLAQFPPGRVMNRPVIANAIGMAAVARLKFGASGIGFDPGFGAFKAVRL